jgi:hypothetical protein
MDPYGDIARWYSSTRPAMNPEAFFQRKLEEALEGRKVQGRADAKLQPAQQEKPKACFQRPAIPEPCAAAAPALDDGGDLSNESLFAKRFALTAAKSKKNHPPFEAGFLLGG